MTIAILDARDKEYVVVAAGADLVATYVQQAIAAGETAQEVLDAILAAGLSEGVFPSIAAGESGTAPGQYFWVGEGGTVTLYLNDGGTGSEVAALATAASLADKVGTADLASPTGGEMVGLEDGNTIQQLSTAQTEAILYSSLYPSLKDAIAAWMTAGGTLVINQDYLTETSVFSTADGTLSGDKTYRLETQGARTIKYTGVATHLAFQRWYAASAAKLFIDADLTIDGNDLCSTGLFLDFKDITGAARRDCLVRGVRTINNRLNAQYSLGANGICIHGGFEFLHIDNCHVENVTRAAASGQVGSWGCIGVQYFGSASTTANAKRMLVENGSITNINSEDTVGTSAYTDMDGLLIFQYSVSGDPVTVPTIRNMVFRECRGRSIKRYCPALGGIVEGITVERSARGRTGGTADIAVQDGSGVVRDIKIRLTGDANVEPSTPVVVGPSGAVDNRGCVVERVNIEDSTGAAVASVVSIFNNNVDTYKRAYTFSDVTHTGTAPAFVRLGGNATTADTDVTLRNINVSLTQGVGMDDSTQQYLKVRCSNFVNRASAVPVKVNLAGVMSGIHWGDWWGDEACKGVHRYVPVWRGNAAFKNGLRGPGGGCVEPPPYGQCEVYGRTPLQTVTIAAGATYSFPPFGSVGANGGDFIAQIRRRDATAVAYTIQAADATVALSVIVGSTPSGWSTLSTGAGSGAGTNIEVWKDSATQALQITNRTADAIAIDLVFNP